MPPSDTVLIESFLALAAEHLEDSNVPYWFIPQATTALRRVLAGELDHWRLIGRELRHRDQAMYVAGQQSRRYAMRA